MYPISPLYAEYLKRHDREFLIRADIDGVIYDNSSIVDFSIENSLTLSGEFELGTAIPSKLTIKLRLKDEIPANARIVPYLALSLANMRWIDGHMPWIEAKWPWTGHVTEWLPLGEFFVDTREKLNDVWQFVCYDKLVWADVPYVSQLVYPAAMKAVWDEICSRLGYTYDGSVRINPAYTLPVAPSGFSMRQVLGYIAGANSASIFVGKDGTVKFKRFAASAPADYEMTVSDYIRVKQTNPVKTYSRVVVMYDEEEQLEYEAGEGDENHTLHVTNPLMTQAMVNNLQAALNGFAYLPMTMDARGFPQLDQGDVIIFDKNDSSPWSETFAAWEDMHLPWLGLNQYQSIVLHQTLNFKGGLAMHIEAPSKSEQQSEFVVEGTLTAQVNKLNKGTVKQGRNYYGVTITRENGLTVDRSDGLAKSVWNADEFAFWAGNDRALWFDVPSRKYKFVGDIVMEAGTISWSRVNPPSASDTGALPSDDPKLSKLSDVGEYLGSLAQGQVEGLSSKLVNISDIGDYIGALSQEQVQGLSTRLTKITSTGVYTGTIGTDQLIAGSALIGNALIGNLEANKITTVQGRITTAQIETLIVGGNVQMGPNATISWGKVTNQPFIPQTAADVGALASNSPMLTHIGPTGIYTGQIVTNQLVAGSTKISAAMIENLVVGSNVQMGPNATISWGNVTNQPFIPQTAADLNALAANSPKLTYIGPTGIYTGTLTAQQINAVQGITLGANATINWAQMNSDPAIATAQSTANNAQSTASGAQSTANGAMSTAQAIAKGEYAGGTFIDRKRIYSPEITAGTITGATLQTAAAGNGRIIMTGAGFRGLNADETLTGLYFNPTSTNIADIAFYHSGARLLEFYDDISQYIIRPGSGASSMVIGYIGKTVNAYGNWNFSNASHNIVAKFA